eukprot:2484624-Karenia_brevis.AAC.1
MDKSAIRITTGTEGILGRALRPERGKGRGKGGEGDGPVKTQWYSRQPEAFTLSMVSGAPAAFQSLSMVSEA